MSLKENKYKALSIISNVFKVLGIIIGIAPTILILFLYGGHIFYAMGMQEIGIILGGLIIGLIIYAQGEFIKLFIDIEENTRPLR